MCQAKPGLRCKQHAMAAVTTAQGRLAQAQQEFNAARTEPRKQQLQQNLRTWRNKLEQARLEMDLSTSGKHALENRIDEAEAENEDASALKNYYDQIVYLSNRRKKFHQTLNKKPTVSEKRAADMESVGPSVERKIIMNRSNAEKLRKELTQQINDGVPDENLDNVVKKIRKLELVADACEKRQENQRVNRVRIRSSCGGNC